MKTTLKTLASLSLLFVAACSSAHSAGAPEVNTGSSCCGDQDKGGCCQEGAKEGKDCCAPAAAPVRKSN
jgi:hypothetical protein